MYLEEEIVKNNLKFLVLDFIINKRNNSRKKLLIIVKNFNLILKQTGIFSDSLRLVADRGQHLFKMFLCFITIDVLKKKKFKF